MRLGEVAKFLNGRAYSQPELLSAGKYPVLRVGNFFTNRNWYYSDLELDEDKYCDHGDLLYAWSASFGPRIWDGGKVIYHYHIWKVLPDPRVVDKRFLYYWLDWDKETIQEQQGAGTTMVHVTKGSIEKRLVALPPLDEQRRIVAILDEAFGAIATATANAEKNLANARGLFVTRLNKLFSDGNKMWKSIPLDSIGKLQTGSTPKSSETGNEGNHIPFIKPGDFRPDGSLDYFNEGLSEKGLSGSRLVSANSALMVCIGATIGKAGFCDRDIAINQQINSVTPGGDVSAKFIYYQMISDDFQNRVVSNAGQATLPIISKGKWGSLPMLIPTRSEQEAIVTTLDGLSESTLAVAAVQRDKLMLLGHLKRSILHQALLGELPTPSALDAAAE